MEEVQKIIDELKAEKTKTNKELVELKAENVELEKQLAEIEAKEPEIIEKVVEVEVEAKADGALQGDIRFLLRCTCLLIKGQNSPEKFGILLEKEGFAKYLPDEITNLSMLRASELVFSHELVKKKFIEHRLRA